MMTAMIVRELENRSSVAAMGGHGPATCLVCESEVALRVVPKLRSSVRVRDLLIALRVLGDDSACSEEMCDVCAPLVVQCDELFSSLRDTVGTLESRRPCLGQVHRLEVAEDFCHIVAEAMDGCEQSQAWPLMGGIEKNSGNSVTCDGDLEKLGISSQIAERDSNLDAAVSGTCTTGEVVAFTGADCEVHSLPSFEITGFLSQVPIKPVREKNVPSDPSEFPVVEAPRRIQENTDVQRKMKPISCASCDESFRSKRSLLAHECDVHGKKPNFRCDTCGKGFDSQDSIQFHRRIHYPDSRLCHLCGKNVSLGSFASHLTAHHRRKPRHACAHCDEAFSRSGSLGLHMKSAHGVADSLLIPGTEEKKCPTCSWTGKNKDYFLSHMFLIHGVRLPGLIEFPCPVCERVFYGNKIFKKHMLTHTRKKA